MTAEHHPSPCQKEQGHHRHQLLTDLPDAADAPQNDHAGEQRGDRAHCHPVPAEGVLQRGGDGVGLDHIPAADGGRHTEEREAQGQGAEPQPLLHVLHGSPLPAPVRRAAAVTDRQDFFRAPRHHAQKGGDPHPEYRPRAAIENGGSHPGDAAGANGGGQGGGKGLDLGQALPPSPPLSGPEQGSQRGPQPQAKAEKLKPAAADRVIKPQQQKSPQQPRVPDPIPHPFQKCHVRPSFW